MKGLRTILLCAAALASGVVAAGQTLPAPDFQDCIRHVDTLLREHSGAKGYLTLRKAVRSGSRLDIYFTESLSDYPLRSGDVAWLRGALQESLPQQYSFLKVGNIFSRNLPAERLVVSSPGSDGAAPSSSLRMKPYGGVPLVTGEGVPLAPMGLDGRHIALWQSHGRYYHCKSGKWLWQRATLFQTVEDLYTQSYVVPLLVPMLEGAGANVLLPRERDPRECEIIIDNDPFDCTSGRIHGNMTASGKWKTGLPGFADAKKWYDEEENPFSMGTALKCEGGAPASKAASVTYSACVPERGEYAVYVSYVTLPGGKSTSCARYTIHALGGDRSVRVNQKMAGGTWVYVGTYEFAAGERTLVTLQAAGTPRGEAVTADAVKIGGGWGCCARSCEADTNATSSGVPRFAEGARYFLQWSGYPAEVWSQNKLEEDYRDDFMCRGSWVSYLCGNSPANPKKEGLGIPVDLSLAFHTDAGTTPDTTTVGTLSIYTLMCDGKSRLPSGGSRHSCRELADFVQTQVVDDIRAQWNPQWKRRMLWNRSYSESRTTSVPAVLLELLSHQNFEDMKYGLDPQFRFCVARSCYKAILKYLSMHYGCPYVVQPLPVQRFSAVLDEAQSMAVLEWSPTEDPLEETAAADSYIVYTRKGDGGWDCGTAVQGTGWSCTVEEGHIYSFRVVAANKGGVSFPSETLSVGKAPNSKGKVLIVNDFTRVSGPVWFDSPTYAGFDNRSDSGVPYLRDWNFIGEQFEFRRDIKYDNDTNCGFGASYEDYAYRIVAGNSFDYPGVHGASILRAGYSFCSCSASAFCAEGGTPPRTGCLAVDLVCGKQCTVKTSCAAPARGTIFSPAMRRALQESCCEGRSIIISGSYIASDAWEGVYPQEMTPSLKAEMKAMQDFVKGTLGYSLQRSHGSRSGDVRSIDGTTGTLHYPTAPCSESYCVENPDALHAFRMGSEIYMSYTDTGLPAGVRCDFGAYRVAAFGFPLEIIDSEDGRDTVLRETLKYLTK